MNKRENNTPQRHLRLKEAAGWFPAGKSLLKAMNLLSDGAFKLFVFLCLNADRHSATYSSSYDRLAAAIGKSHHTLEAYADELTAKGICSLAPSLVPYVGTTFRIAEEYWPYHSNGAALLSPSDLSYVDSIRNSFLSLGCTNGRFGPSEEGQAQDFQRRKIALNVIEDAMLIGACRKYVSWLNNGPSEPISSLRYFEQVIEEVQERPFPSGYLEYMRYELQKLSSLWKQKTESLQGKESCVTRSLS